MDDAGLEMKREAVFLDDLPALDPVIAHEITERGWRALTGDGEVLVVNGREGQPVSVPESDIVVWRQGKPIGRRALTNDLGLVRIEDYLDSFDRAVASYRANNLDEALHAAEATVALAPTLRARFNLAMVLLAMGRWVEGLSRYECRLEFGEPFLRIAETGDIPRWQGESLVGKRLLLMHEQGFGDTIMMLRYVPFLRALGAEVALAVPPELERISIRCAEIARPPFVADFYCPMMSLLHRLGQIPESVPGEPYLKVDPRIVARRKTTIGQWDCPKIGIAWTVGKHVDGDFPRSIPLDLLVDALDPEAELYSLQTQGTEDAQAFGVHVTELEDFADCAALASLMDEIVCVDTAALHVAGAIGHQRTTALLSHWSSWRYRDNPFYPGIRLCRQTSPGDWPSALAQLQGGTP
jgi:hypothetical protein